MDAMPPWTRDWEEAIDGEGTQHDVLEVETVNDENHSIKNGGPGRTTDGGMLGAAVYQTFWTRDQTFWRRDQTFWTHAQTFWTCDDLRKAEGSSEAAEELSSRTFFSHEVMWREPRWEPIQEREEREVSHPFAARRQVLGARSLVLGERSPVSVERSPVPVKRSPVLEERSPVLGERSPGQAKMTVVLARRIDVQVEAIQALGQTVGSLRRLAVEREQKMLLMKLKHNTVNQPHYLK